MSPELLQLVVWSTVDTLVMVGLSGLFGTLLGLPLGIFLATSRANELFPAPAANRILGLIVNATRSTPFIILVVAIVPLTRLIAGTSIGTRAAVVPLTIAAIPFIARVIEAAIREVDQGLVEAARAFGASPLQIVQKVLLPEAMPAVSIDADRRQPAWVFRHGRGGWRRRLGRCGYSLRLPAIHAGSHGHRRACTYCACAGRANLG